MEHTPIPTIRPPDTDAPTGVTTAIVDAIADAEGVSLFDVSPPLASVVDPDSLNALVSSMDEDATAPNRIEFAYSGHVVTVTAAGEVTVSEDFLEH